MAHGCRLIFECFTDQLPGSSFVSYQHVATCTQGMGNDTCTCYEVAFTCQYGFATGLAGGLEMQFGEGLLLCRLRGEPDSGKDDITGVHAATQPSLHTELG